MRLSTLSIVTTVITACAQPECPKCPCATRADAGAPDDGGPSDSGIEESDASVKSQFNQKPQEVTEYELHGRAGFDKVSIFSQPDMESPRLGYLRKGTRRMVGDPKYASEGCPKGWFKLKEGGFVCQGRGMLVGNKPRYIPRVPPKARVDELDPYRHGFVRRDWTPSYKRVPTEEEMWTPPVKEAETDTATGDGGPTAEPEFIHHDEDGADGGVNYYKYVRRFRAVRNLLSRGFWISVGSRRYDENTRQYYYETIKGDYVPGNEVHLIKPPRFKGYEVLGETPLPCAIVKDKHASFFRLRNNRFRGIGPVERLAVYRVYEVHAAGRTAYYKIEGDRWLKSTQTTLFELTQPPEGIRDRQQWIRIDLSSQTLVAYEGNMPVYATLISSGLPGNVETETPTGDFSIRFKHLTDDMAGSVGDDEVYSVEDVPWVQYVHRNIALHASFWHSSYGRPKSHGCINLAPADARWLFDWSLPKLPDGWHGVATTDKNPGTKVIIEGKTPETKR